MGAPLFDVPSAHARGGLTAVAPDRVDDELRERVDHDGLIVEPHTASERPTWNTNPRKPSRAARLFAQLATPIAGLVILWYLFSSYSEQLGR